MYQKALAFSKKPIHDESLDHFLNDKNILVSGGCGSIGSEIVRQACQYKPKQIIALDQCELRTFQNKASISQHCPDVEVIHVMGDIRNSKLVNNVIQKYQINIIYHAAAYKHVPLMEDNPYQAIRNNVGGTWKLLDAAAKNGVSTFVNISTDKAVNPRNVMGASKRINELLVREFGRIHGNTGKFLSVRFGNVFGSSGSVGPTFEKQIRSGGPVKVTDKLMTRYMMNISEAAQLVLVSSSFPKLNDSIYVLDMGEPIQIIDLAKTMIQYMEKPETDIVFTGIRKGEKLDEILSTHNEKLEPTDNSRIQMVQDSASAQGILGSVRSLLDQIHPGLSGEEVSRRIQEIIPEYNPSSDFHRYTRGSTSSLSSNGS